MSDDSCVFDDVSLDLLEEERFDLEVDVLKLSEVFCVLLPNWALEEENLWSGELDLRNGELNLEGSGGELDLGVKELDLEDGGEEESLVDKVDWLEDEEHWDETSDSLKYIIIHIVITSVKQNECHHQFFFWSEMLPKKNYFLNIKFLTYLDLWWLEQLQITKYNIDIS